MAKHALSYEPELIHTLFGIEEAPPPPAWRIRQRASEGAKKFCTYCRADRPLSEFRASRVSADGITPHCQPCCNILARARYAKSPKAKKRVTDVHRQKTYGLSPEDFDRIKASQDGKCDICQADLKPGKFTHIDHCHKTGQIRALLCMKCNATVGVIENMPADVAKYYAYIAHHAGLHRRSG